MAPFADPSLPVSQALSRVFSSPVPPYSRALARNLLAEQRVSGDRFALFSAFAGDIAELNLIQRAMELYQLREVRPLASAALQPAYARPENESNKVELPPGSHVATVLNLTRLSRIYAEAWATFRIPEFQTCALPIRSEEHTSELQSPCNLVCRLLLEKK